METLSVHIVHTVMELKYYNTEELQIQEIISVFGWLLRTVYRNLAGGLLVLMVSGEIKQSNIV